MPSFERLLALRFSWILVRLGVIVGLTLSLALPAASALKDDAKDLLGEVEDSKVEPEKEKDAEPIGALVLSQRCLAGLRTGAAETLAAFHAEEPDLAGMSRERLRLALTPRLPKDAFLIFLRQEANAGRAVLDGAFVRLPGHEVRLSPEDEALFTRLLPQLQGETRFRPPRVRDFAKETGIEEREIRRVFKLTQKLGRTDQIARDHFFDRTVTAEMVGILLDVAACARDGWFAAPAFRDRLQNGRKVAIEILDFFDRQGLTLRRGDLRRINPHRADLFDG